MSSYVYKYVKNDEVIYIGKCDRSLKVRINAHKYDHLSQHLIGSTIYYTEVPDAYSSDFLESALINKYHPKYNKAKNQILSIAIDDSDIQWYKYMESPRKKNESRSSIKKGINCDILQSKMRKKHLNAKQIAKITGYPPSTIYNICGGVICNPNIITIKAITDVLEITLDEII